MQNDPTNALTFFGTAPDAGTSNTLDPTLIAKIQFYRRDLSSQLQYLPTETQAIADEFQQWYTDNILCLSETDQKICHWLQTANVEALHEVGIGFEIFKQGIHHNDPAKTISGGMVARWLQPDSHQSVRDYFYHVLQASLPETFSPDRAYLKHLVQLHRPVEEILSIMSDSNDQDSKDFLFKAAYYSGHTAFFEAMMPNISDEELYQGFYQAASRGYTDILALCLDYLRIDPNSTAKNAVSPALFDAITAGQLGSIQQFLAHPRVDATQTARKGHTILHWAALAEQPRVLRYLLAHEKCASIDINAYGDRETALYHAAEKNQGSSVELLLSRDNIEVNAQCGSEQRTALQVAIIQGHADIARRLIADKRTEINTHDRSGSTALHTAAEYKRTDIVRALLAHPEIDTSIKSSRRKHSDAKDSWTAKEMTNDLEIIELMEAHEAAQQQSLPMQTC